MPKQNEVRKRRNQAVAAVGLAAMAAVGGAIAALLLAPKSGRETRKDLKDRAHDAKHKGRDMVDHAKKDVEDRAHRARDSYEEAVVEAQIEADERATRRGLWGRK